jgi:hypothetical protein
LRELAPQVRRSRWRLCGTNGTAMNYTRRDFLLSVPLAGGAMALGAVVLRPQAAMHSLAGAVDAGASVPGAPVSVLSFHLDQPWVDASGMAEAYHPPAGARGAEPLALLDEQTLSRYYGLI